MKSKQSRYEKYPCEKKHRKDYNKRYYARTSGSAHNSREQWTEKEIKMILAREVSDTELAKVLGRSVRAIQVQRCKLKKQVL